jgi:hypothetical protein
LDAFAIYTFNVSKSQLKPIALRRKFRRCEFAGVRPRADGRPNRGEGGHDPMLTYFLLRFVSLAVVFSLIWALGRVTDHGSRLYRSLRTSAGHSLSQGRA